MIERHASLEIKVTDRCNQRCAFCMNRDGSAAGADIDSRAIADRLREWYRNRASSSCRVTEVRMTGGEPLLALAAVTEIARACGEAGIRSGINTNATLLDRPTATRLRSAGLEVFKASLDAVDARTYRALRGPGASLSRAIEGLEVAAAAGFELVVRFTLTQRNRSELLACHRLACELGAAAFQVKPVIAAGRALERADGSSRALAPAELIAALAELAEASAEGPTAAVVLCCSATQAAGLPTKACGSIDKTYFATSGEACLCNYLPPGEPMGNLLDEPLERILARRAVPLVQTPGGDSVPAGCPQWP